MVRGHCGLKALQQFVDERPLSLSVPLTVGWCGFSLAGFKEQLVKAHTLPRLTQTGQ